MNNNPKVGNGSLYNRICEILEQARQRVYKTANFEMVQAYWEMGREIVEEEQQGGERAEYGKKLLKELSVRLTQTFGKGFDESNLRNIRRFYHTFPIRDALRHELSWTHYRLLMRVVDHNARSFYIQEAIQGNWSTRQLERQINSLYYNRIQQKAEQKKPSKGSKEKSESANIEELIKDPFVLEFLDIKQNHKLSEKGLETALIDKLQDFILELGKGFAFVERQHRITTETGNHFYIDLVFYNYMLKCFLLIDLKTHELTHQDIGQMDMYVRMFEDLRKQEGDNPTIGLILCTEKDKTIVKYSILQESKQLFASKYQTYLPSVQELKHEIQRGKEHFRNAQKLK